MWTTSGSANATPRSSPRRAVSASRRAPSPTVARRPTSPYGGVPCAAHRHHPHIEHPSSILSDTNKSVNLSSAQHAAAIDTASGAACAHTLQRVAFFDRITKAAVDSAHSDMNGTALRGELVALRLRNAALEEENRRLRDAVADAAIDRRRSGAAASASAATNHSSDRLIAASSTPARRQGGTVGETSDSFRNATATSSLLNRLYTAFGPEGVMGMIRDAIAAAAEVCLAAGADAAAVDSCVSGPVRTIDKQARVAAAAVAAHSLEESDFDALRASCTAGLHAVRVVLATVGLPQLKTRIDERTAAAATTAQRTAGAATMTQWQQRALRAEREVELLRALQLSAVTHRSARSVKQPQSSSLAITGTPASSAPPTTKRRLASIDDDDAL